MKIKVALLSFTLTAILSACGTTERLTGETRTNIKSQFEEVKAEAMAQTNETKRMGNIKFVDRFHIKPMDKESNKPDWYYEEVDLAFNSVTLSKALAIIQRSTKIVPRFMQSVNPDKKFPINHVGNAGEAIEKIALSTGYGVDFDGHIVTFTQFETKIIPVVLPPSISSFRIGEKDDNSSNQNAGGYGETQVIQEEQSSSYSAIEMKDLDPSVDLLQVMQALKSGEGKIAYDRTSSLLTVVDYPKNVADIQNYIDTLNMSAMTNVAFDLRFVEFRDSSGEGESINWNLALQDIQVNSDVAVGGVMQSLFTDTLLTGSAPLSLGFEALNGKWSGSQLLIEALSNQGTVMVHEQPRVFASHNRLSRFDVGADRAYAANATSNQNQTSTASSLTAGLLSLGVEISILPTVVHSKNEVYVQLGIRLSDLADLRDFSSDGSRIQLPEKSKRNFTLNFSARDGETVLLSGNRSNRSEFSSKGSGWLSMLLGGSQSSSDEYNELLIMITPRITKRGV